MSQSTPLRGRVALITGATSGIGWGIARALAAQGCDILLHGLGTPELIEQFMAELQQKHGVSARHDGADLTDPTQIEAMCHDAVARFGRVDILINNAGVQHTDPVDSFPPQRWDELLAVNLTAAFHTIRLLLPTMRTQGWGRIVQTASTHGLVASIDKAAYVASKHGLIGLTKVVALETAEDPITCNAICPGWTRTPLVEQQIAARAEATGSSVEEAASNLVREKQPTGEFVTVEQIGSLVVFLCSEAAEQITGASLTIDGGWTAQ